ncbi:transposase [Streptosporangium saharense]|uniref:transposase n=1 Tax=Streptosporangium saharense TaxID=1706840 RepID=UPI00343E3D6B
MLIGPLLPIAHWDGRKKKHPRRNIVDAISYVVRTGCSWRQLPVDFPPWQTVYWHFARWENKASPSRSWTCCVSASLRRPVGRRSRRRRSSTAKASRALTPSGLPPRGYDASKRINGHKRFVATNTGDLLLGLYLTGVCRVVFAGQR